MSIKMYSDKVRVVTELSPFGVQHDVKVEVLVDGEWTLRTGYNSLSNDSAYSNAAWEASELITSQLFK